MALTRLYEETQFDGKKILQMPLEQLQQTIRSSGFYKNKGKSDSCLDGLVEPTSL